MVPKGKRLIIDTIGFQGDSEGGHGFAKAAITSGGQSMAYIIPSLSLKSPATAGSVVGSASIPFHADPGSAVVMTYYRGAGAPKQGVTRMRFSLLGRYVDTRAAFV